MALMMVLAPGLLADAVGHDGDGASRASAG